MATAPHSGAACAPHAAALSRRHVLATGFATMAATGLRAAPANATETANPPRALTAQTTEGPYFLDAMPLRADITEGLPGVSLEVRLQVTDASGQALPEWRVDIWQCDAAGVYSGYAGQGDDKTTSAVGKTFLRGALLTGADGTAVFRSLYPGWYEGRTTHIHFKVRSGQRHVLTSQFFLPDALSEFLYTRLPDYRRASLRNVLNSTDGIAMMAGDTVIGAVREAAGRYVASLTLVIDPLANAPAHRPGPGSGPPPGASGRGGPPPGFGGVPALKAPEGEARATALVPGPRAR